MSQSNNKNILYFYKNQVEEECKLTEYTCLLTEWLKVREAYPTARLYQDCVCVQNDLTPKTKQACYNLRHATGTYYIVAHAGEPLTLGIIAAVISVGVAAYTYFNMPQVDTADSVQGSPNNALSNRQNKPRLNQRVPDNYGNPKSIPDVIGTTYRTYEDNIQVEETLLSIGTGYYDIDPKHIKEGDTPFETIEGGSLSIYEPNQSLIDPNPQIKLGSDFAELPIVTKPISNIDGRQKLIPPNNKSVTYTGVTLIENGLSVPSYQGREVALGWYDKDGDWHEVKKTIYANFTNKFNTGEKVVITNAIADDYDSISLSGNADISTEGILTIASSIDHQVTGVQTIAVSSMLVTDPVNGMIDLAGVYPLNSINKIDANGSYIYEIALSKYAVINPNFALLTENAVSIVAVTLSDKANIIDLSGTYTVASVSDTKITLANPASVNSNWDNVNQLTTNQINNLKTRTVKFAGSSSNWHGWYYAGNPKTEGFLVNFIANNGVYDGDKAKSVNIEIEYQLTDAQAEPVGEVKRKGITLSGKANNRTPIGKTLKQVLPENSSFRFRVRRVNTKSDSANLIDDVVIESAYSYYTTTKSVYEYDTVIRLKRMAIGSGTNASELNLIPHRKLQTPNGFMATSNFADIVYDMATSPFIGRMTPDEIDLQDLHDIHDEMVTYFGTPKACEFNYTFDDSHTSYQEMVFTVAEAVFCTARRENGENFMVFEKQTPNSLMLFNHRNTKPDSLTITEFFDIEKDFDGVEFIWRDPNDNHSEAVIKLPHQHCTNYRKIESRGVTNHIQAHLLAHRAWNRLKYNRKAIELTAYGEGDLVTISDRIAVVDDTKPRLYAGEVVGQDVTTLMLDYPIELDDSKKYVIHLQTRNNVEVIEIVDHDKQSVQLSRLPHYPLIENSMFNSMYEITEDTTTNHNAYIIKEKSSAGLFETKITAMSYDDRYYKNDQDYIRGLIDET